MSLQGQFILIISGMSFLALAVLGGLWVHLGSQRSPMKTAGKYVMQLHLFCLLFGILLLSLSNAVPLTAYSEVTKHLIAYGMIVGGVCFAIRTFILAVTGNPNVYQVPNRLANGFAGLFVVLTGVSIFVILVGILLAVFS